MHHYGLLICQEHCSKSTGRGCVVCTHHVATEHRLHRGCKSSMSVYLPHQNFGALDFEGGGGLHVEGSYYCLCAVCVEVGEGGGCCTTQTYTLLADT